MKAGASHPMGPLTLSPTSSASTPWPRSPTSCTGLRRGAFAAPPTLEKLVCGEATTAASPGVASTTTRATVPPPSIPGTLSPAPTGGKRLDARRRAWIEDSIDRIRSATFHGRAPRIRDSARSRPVPQQARGLARVRRRRPDAHRGLSRRDLERESDSRRARSPHAHDVLGAASGRRPSPRHAGSVRGRGRRAKADESARASADQHAAEARAAADAYATRGLAKRPRTRRPGRDPPARRQRRRDARSPRGGPRRSRILDDGRSKRRGRHGGRDRGPQASAATGGGSTCSGFRARSPAPSTEHRAPGGSAPSSDPNTGRRPPKTSRKPLGRSEGNSLKVNTRRGQPPRARARGRSLAGGPERHHRKTAEQGKLPVRERVRGWSTRESFAEEALLANWEQEGLGADGVVTGPGARRWPQVALMANDPTVKAGSWGPKTVEKILRDPGASAAARAADGLPGRLGRRPDHRPGADVPGRRGAGRIFYNEVRLSGRVPQVCLLFGPSAAGGAYIPAFCDVVIMREGNASMYLGSPRMAEMVIGEKVTLEEMGGAKMHTSVSGCGHFLVRPTRRRSTPAKRYLSFMPPSWREAPPPAPPAEPAGAARAAEIVPADENAGLRHRRPDRRAASTQARFSRCKPLGEGADGRLRAARRPRDRHRRQPAEGQGRRAVRRLRRQGRPLHLDLQRLQRPAALPGRRPRVHDRHPGRAPGDHPPRREDDLRRLRGHRAEALGDRPQGLRRRPLRDGRARLRARLLHRAAHRLDRRDGAGGGDQRGLLQPDPGDRRPGRARGVRASESATSTPPTSTSSTSPPSWWSTP